MAYWKIGKSSGDTIGSIGTSYDTGDGNIKQFVMDEIIPEDEAILYLQRVIRSSEVQ